jgi:putative ABC transport system substrate-binding protein
MKSKELLPMRRRDVLALLGSAAAWPTLGRAQIAAPFRIGVIAHLPPGPYAAPYADALRRGLRDAALIEGVDIVLEERWTYGDPALLATYAEELRAADVDIVLTHSTLPTQVVSGIIKDIPIVFAVAGDPVESGLVQTLARPGGNVTGLAYFSPELMAKRVEILREAAPAMKSLALLAGPAPDPLLASLRSTEVAARTLGFELTTLTAQTLDEYVAVFEAMATSGIEGVIVDDQAHLLVYAQTIVELARDRGIALVGALELARLGGLIGYSPDIPQLFYRSGQLIGRILRGVRPSDLPVEQAGEFVLVVNVRSATELGLSLPPTLLARATEVIE